MIIQISPLDPPLCLQYLKSITNKVDFYLITDVLTAACCMAYPALFIPLCETQCLQNFWLHSICTCTERYSRACISQALAVHWDVKYAENWLL